MKKNAASIFRLAVVGCLALIALAGCRESEQDRILMYKKGNYLGPQDAPLAERTVETLRARGAHQNFN